MQLGMIGLGRMGANIVRRLMRDGHECVVYDVGPEAVAQLESEGATGSESLDDFVAKLDRPRVAWVMIPAGITGRVVDDLAARIVQRPSPESDTRPPKPERSDSVASAAAVRSRSHDATTLPRRQTSATSATSMSYW